jgi:hypothetical protein
METQSLDQQITVARDVVYKMERISADSTWAHSSSGYRGSLWRAIDRMEIARETSSGLPEEEMQRIAQLIERSYELLILAAREIPYKPT